MNTRIKEILPSGKFQFNSYTYQIRSSYNSKEGIFFLSISRVYPEGRTITSEELFDPITLMDHSFSLESDTDFINDKSIVSSKDLVDFFFSDIERKNRLANPNLFSNENQLNFF
jgi:hypothetical protein